jgi:hypothetical protein
LLWIETSTVCFGLYHLFLGCLLHPSNANEIQRSFCALARERVLKSFSDLSTYSNRPIITIIVLIAGGGISGLALLEKIPFKKLQQQLLTLD